MGPEFKSRIVPILAVLFNEQTLSTPQMGAVIDVLSPELARIERFGFTFKIQHAYSNDYGDVLFHFGYEWYLKPKDSKWAYKLDDAGFGGTFIKFHVPFDHEGTGSGLADLNVDEKENKVRITADFIQENGFAKHSEKNLKILTKDQQLDLLDDILLCKIKFVDLPERRAVELAVRKENGDFVIVTCNKADYDYSTLKIFAGSSLGDLQEIPLAEFSRQRDGGTSFYVTDRGILFSPSPICYAEAHTKWLSGAGLKLADQKIDEWLRSEHLAERVEEMDVNRLSKQVPDHRIGDAYVFVPLEL